MDTLLNKAREVTDQKERSELYREGVEKVTGAHRGILYLYHQNYIVAFPKGVKGYKGVPDGLVRIKGVSWQWPRDEGRGPTPAVPGRPRRPPCSSSSSSARVISRVTLFLISLIVFTGVRLIPGDPPASSPAPMPTEAGLEDIRQKYGLKDPIPVQYVRWIGLALRGDLGESIRTRESVARIVGLKLPITLQLAAYALLVALLIAIPDGVSRRCAGTRCGTTWPAGSRWGASRSPTSGSASCSSSSSRCAWAGCRRPGTCRSPRTLGNTRRMIMPAFVLGTALAAVLMRQTRNSMIEVLSADYIRTAYSKGLARPVVVFRHADPERPDPVITIFGLQMGALISGAVVTEQIFVVPGFGRLIVESVFTRDYPLVQGVVLITASAYVLINLLVDVSYSC